MSQQEAESEANIAATKEKSNTSNKDEIESSGVELSPEKLPEK